MRARYSKHRDFRTPRRSRTVQLLRGVFDSCKPCGPRQPAPVLTCISTPPLARFASASFLQLAGARVYALYLTFLTSSSKRCCGCCGVCSPKMALRAVIICGARRPFTLNDIALTVDLTAPAFGAFPCWRFPCAVLPHLAPLPGPAGPG